MVKIVILVIIQLLFISIRVYSQKISEEEKDILMLQDTRRLGEHNKLLNYLHSSQENLRVKSLYALANIADTISIDEIGKVLLNDSAMQVREYAAFALGQILNKKSAEFLLKSLYGEQNADVLCRILDAIGRTGNEEDLNKVCDYQTENDSINAFIAMSIARFGMRKIKNERGFEKLDSIVSKTFQSNKLNETILKNAVYAYNRAGDEKFLNRPNRFNPNTLLFNSNSPEIRMWSYSVLGKKKNDPMLFTAALPGMADFTETDWRVRVNALNTLLNFNYKIQIRDPVTRGLLNGVDDSNESISLLIIQSLGKIFADTVIDKENMKKIKEKLESVLESNNEYSFRQKSESAIALASIFKDKMRERLIKVYKNTNDWDLKAGIIRAFGKFENGMIYKEVRNLIREDLKNKLTDNGNNLKIYRAFIEMLTFLDKKINEAEKNNVRLIYSEFLEPKDPILIDNCLSALMDSIYNKYRGETSKIIMFDYAGLNLPEDADVMQLYIQAMGEMKITDAAVLLEKNLQSENYDIAKVSADALEKITGKNYESEISASKYRTDFDWEYIEKLNDKKFVIMKTNRGDIKLELFPEIAPLTAQNFLKLAEKHYYDGTIFHRVVPNFVIQGGDPTGTGYSGPGYSIRSELSPMTYETGYLGMASSGKDTEGSQFFITHSPQPHLDGRYTIFGKVTEGMETVDKIQIGDVLLQVEFGSE